MADYAPNLTKRLKLRYNFGHGMRTATFRFARGAVTVAEAQDVVVDVLTSLLPILPTTWATVDWRYCAEDTDVFLPVSGPTVTGIATTSLAFPGYGEEFINFVGISAEAGRASFYLYGTTIHTSVNGYRLFAADSVPVEDALNDLNTITIASMVANDNSRVSWYPYVNVKANDYWVRQDRAS